MVSRSIRSTIKEQIMLDFILSRFVVEESWKRVGRELEESSKRLILPLAEESWKRLEESWKNHWCASSPRAPSFTRLASVAATSFHQSRRLKSCECQFATRLLSSPVGSLANSVTQQNILICGMKQMVEKVISSLMPSHGRTPRRWGWNGRTLWLGC